MQKGKLFLLIDTLKTEEYKAFSIFLQAPYFTKSEDVIRLWSLLIKLKKRSQLDRITKEQVFKKLFPSVSFSDIKMRNLMRKLTKVLEDFLVQKELESETTDREILLNKIYRKRNIFSLFEKSGKKLSKALEEKQERGSYYFLEKYQWKKQHYFHPNTEKNTISVLQLKDAFRDLHHFYSIEKLQMEVELRNQERIYSKQYEDDFFDTRIEGFAAPVLLKKVAALIELQDLKIYEEVKTLFYKKLEKLSEVDQNIIYPALLNYINKQIFKKEDFFLKEALELYKIGLSNKLLLSDGEISGSTFFNITIAGSILHEFKWVSNFFKTYENQISAFHKSDFILMSRAYWFFHQEKYNESLECIMDYKFNYPMLNLNAKSLISRIYYELSTEDYSFQELALNHLLSFEKFLKRSDRLYLSKKQAYLNFIYILYKILKLDYHQASFLENKKQIEKEIKSSTNIIARKWLLKATNRKN